MVPSAIVGHTLYEALSWLGIVAIAYALATIVSRMGIPLAKRLTSKTKTKLDDYLLEAVRAPLHFIIIVQGLFIALTTLSFTTGEIQDYVNGGWRATSMGVVFWALQRVVSSLLSWYGAEVSARTRTNWDDQFLPIIRRMANGAILAIGVLVVLAELGLQISPLLAGLGIGGLAIALALQPTLSNFISGTYVLSDGSIRTGDYVEIQGGPAGTIQEVGWRITKILSVDNNLVTMPNSKLADSVITNYSQPEPTVNMVLGVGASYESDLNKVERVCLEVMQQIQDRLKEVDKSFSPVLRYSQFGDSNVSFNLVMRGVDRGATFLIKHELMKAIHSRFAAEGIEVNYPVRKIIYPTNGNGHAAKGVAEGAGEATSRGLLDTDGESEA